jgi:hypothetical protein
MKDSERNGENSEKLKWIMSFSYVMTCVCVTGTASWGLTGSIRTTSRPPRRSAVVRPWGTVLLWAFQLLIKWLATIWKLCRPLNCGKFLHKSNMTVNDTSNKTSCNFLSSRRSRTLLSVSSFITSWDIKRPISDSIKVICETLLTKGERCTPMEYIYFINSFFPVLHTHWPWCSLHSHRICSLVFR